MQILTEDDMGFWKENGYVIVKQAVPADHVSAVVDAIWEFQQMRPDDPDSWYRKPERLNGMPELNGSGMVEMYHHPAMWANRQMPKVHGAFADIWGTEKLWVTIDRVKWSPDDQVVKTVSVYVANTINGHAEQITCGSSMKRM